MVISKPNTTTSYIVFSEREGCPPATDTVTITITESTPPDAGPNQWICPGGSVELQGSGAVIYLWTPSSGLSCTDCPNPLASPDFTTIYKLTSIGTDCPVATDQVTVTVLSPPEAFAGENRSITRGSNITLNASGGVAYKWINDNSTGESIQVAPQRDSVFCVEVKDMNSCVDTACVAIQVTEPVTSSLWIPSCFTPNEDLVNPVFLTPGENIIEYHASIFNRWGELIYEWADIEKGWDGTYKGAYVPQDIYAYRIKALGADGVKYQKRGMILVVK